ncbi:protease inhibitor I42 family protein [Stutzerimonas tarimensis]|uniref:Protease inhibitor I42 family protein n=1 Tax=Stutzerimonas tarimensis TaxID=1507735 RepID=A0ABV7T7J0_9GAMM
MTDFPRLLLAASLVALGACASTPPSSVTLTHDRKCPVALQSGQTLILSLPSNPASGYRWQADSLAGEVLRSLGPEVFSNPDSGVIGGDGLSTWRFEAARAGEDRLHLSYRQPWEPEGEPGAEFDCRVRVR